MLKFLKLPRGVKQRSRKKTRNAVFCSVQNNVPQKGGGIKIINDYKFIGRRSHSSRSVCSRRIFQYGWHGSRVCGGLGFLTASQINENGKNCSTSKRLFWITTALNLDLSSSSSTSQTLLSSYYSLNIIIFPVFHFTEH